MKNLSNLILEGVAKDVKVPRKGSTVYILKDGSTKATPIKVVNVQKIKNSWYGREGGYDVAITLAENEYKLDGWISMHHGDPWLDEPIQVDVKSSPELGTYYIGTSKEVIAEFIKKASTKELKKLLKQIADAENQLAELNKKKDILQQKIDAEITESLHNS